MFLIKDKQEGFEILVKAIKYCNHDVTDNIWILLFTHIGNFLIWTCEELKTLKLSVLGKSSLYYFIKTIFYTKKSVHPM